MTDLVVGPLTNTERITPITPDLTQGGGVPAEVRFSQVKGVTGLVYYIVIPGAY